MFLNNRTFIFSLFFCILNSLLINPVSANNPKNIQFIGVEDGLSHRHVEAIFQDSKGIMWIGTEFGLDRYDGYDFIRFNISESSPIQLSSSNIIDIEETKEGLLLVGTSNGLNILDFENRTNRIILHAKDPTFKSKGSEVYFIKAIKEAKDGTIWLSDGGKLCKIRDIHNPVLEYVELKYDDGNENIVDIEEDLDGNIWLTTGKNIVIQIYYDGIKYHKISKQLDVRNAFNSVHAPSKFIKNTEGELFTLSWSNQDLIYNLDNTSKEFIPLIDHWLFTRLSTTIRTHISKNESISKNFHLSDYVEDIKCVSYSEDGLIWVGTTFGIFKIKPSNDFFFTDSNLKKVSLRGMVETNSGDIFIGSYSGLIKYNPQLNKLKIFHQKNQPYVSSIKVLSEDQLLLGTEGNGLYFFNLNSEKFSRVEKEDPRFEYVGKHYQTLFQEQSNTNLYWIGAGNSVFTLDLNQNNKVEEFHDNKNTPFFQGKKIYHFYQDANQIIWVATRVGLFKIKPDKSVEGVKIFKENLFAPSPCIYFIHSDQPESLWLGSRERGLIHLDLKNNQTHSYTTNEGLCNNRVYSILQAEPNTLWMATDNGLSRFDIQKKKFTNFYEKDGLSSNEFNTHAYLKTRSGKLYFGGIDGFTAIAPTTINTVTTNSKLLPSKLIKYDSEEKELKEQFFNLSPKKIVSIGINEKFFEMSFTLTDYFNPSNNRFAFYLEGYDEDWIYHDNSNTIRYTNLPTGNYHLKVMASGSDGMWKEDVLSIPINVQQSIYKSKWFFLLPLFIISSILYLLFYFRLYQIRQIEQLKTKLAEDLHDDIGSTLTNIRLLAGFVKEKNSNKKVEKEIGNIIDMSREAVSNMSDIVWSLNKEKEQFKHLIDRMRGYLNNIFAPLEIPYKMKVSGVEDSLKLSINQRQNILLIFKEAVQNIIKHSCSPKVDISFVKTGNQYILTIYNEFQQNLVDADGNQMGLKSMKRRAKKIGGNLIFKKADNSFSVVLVLDTI